MLEMSPSRSRSPKRFAGFGLDVLFLNIGIGRFRPLGQWDPVGSTAHSQSALTARSFRSRRCWRFSPIRHRSSSIRRSTRIERLYADQSGVAVAVPRASGEVIGRGIGVNPVSPGPVATALHGTHGMSEAHIAGLENNPVRPPRRPERDCSRSRSLASDEGAFAVSNEFVIDSGMSALKPLPGTLGSY